jgi:parallel beta-helix repeat protein
MKMKTVFLSMAVAAALLTTSARAASVGTCTAITPSPPPITIATQGVYCLQGDIATSIDTGNLIEITTDNVTIDLNGFKLGGLAAGTATTATGIFALDRINITIRNGTIRGFQRGIALTQGGSTSSGHLVEHLLLEQNRFTGVFVQGTGNVIRNNNVVKTGLGGSLIEANGILVTDSNNTVIADNVVSGTSETNTARGIYVSNSALIEVRDNSILDTGDATTKFGIEINNSTDVTVIDNRIINAAGAGSI